MYNKPYEQCPRDCLKRQIQDAQSMGYFMKSGIEPEFMLLTKDGKRLYDECDMQQPMSLQDPHSTLRHSNFLCELADCMEKIGWNPYEIDHESSCCQYEINFDYVDCLKMSDRQMFMKFMIKQLAEIHGVKASFMAVPLPEVLCANGLHTNISLWNSNSTKNLFEDDTDEIGLSSLGYNFIGGLLNNIESACALYCSTVNSYKRLNRGVWCPNKISWGGNNRSVLIRVPVSDRIELRLPDAAANPYLMHAAILSTGLDGIKNKTDPGPRVDFDVQNYSGQFKKVPMSLDAALNKLESNEFLRESLGQGIIDGFLHMKRKEWDSFMSQITQWEINYYSNI
ncbi:DgyrCDS8096 [Dimorphilus gyrociliatus]|nr:DgyrCDS8096 [Dimorphilus gyrociliatus]